MSAAEFLASAATGTPTSQAPGPRPEARGPRPDQTVLTRAELDTALGDFGRLAASFRASFTPAGAQLHTVAPDSILGRLGLRAGDTISAIDGKPLRTLDDAADLYARAPALRAATIELVRADQPLTLRVEIR
jgi:S1-C subfamily serine protease